MVCQRKHQLFFPPRLPVNKDFDSGGYVNINPSVNCTRYANANTNYFSPSLAVDKDFGSDGYVTINPLYSGGFSHIFIQ